MGGDDLHQKRKAKRKRDLARRKSRREPYGRVLIVCEGEKTEPHYFLQLVACLKLNTNNVKVDGNCGSSPKSVVRYAKRRYQDEKVKGDTYDRVYCVFDKDAHVSFEQSVSELINMTPKGVFKPI